MEGRAHVVLTWTGYAAFLIIGWGTVLLPDTLRAVERSLSVDDAALGLYFLVATFCAAVGAVLYGRFARRLRLRLTILWCLALLGLTWVLQAASGAWLVFFIVGSLGALVNSAMDAAVNSAVLQATPADRAGRTLNRLHLTFGIGCIVGAAAIGRLVLAGVGWRALFVGTGVLTLTTVVVLEGARTLSGTADPDQSPPAGERLSFQQALRTSRTGAVRFLLLACATGLYVGSEIALTNWLPTFYSSIDAQAASLVLGVFWAGLTLGRLLIGPVSDRVSIDGVLVAASLAGAVLVLGSLGVGDAWAGVLLVGASGVFYGPIYPLLMVKGAQIFADHIGAMSGGLTAAATVGGACVPALLGVLSNAGHLEAGLAGAGGLLVVVAGGMGGVVVLQRRARGLPSMPAIGR